MKKGRIPAYIAACLLPAAVVFYGTVLLWGDYLLTGTFALAYFILPALAIAGCILVIRCKLRPAFRTVLCVILVVVAMVLSLGLAVFGEFSMLTQMKGDDALETYSVVAAEIPEFPEVSELGAPERTEYYHFSSIFAVFFDCDCDILICSYDDDEYTRHKEMLDTQYKFRQEPAAAHGHQVEPTAMVDGYEFRMVESKKAFSFPKRMVYVATNDEVGEIAYLYYVDEDLDWIDYMEEHIQNDFGWKYIR